MNSCIRTQSTRTHKHTHSDNQTLACQTAPQSCDVIRLVNWKRAFRHLRQLHVGLRSSLPQIVPANCFGIPGNQCEGGVWQRCFQLLVKRPYVLPFRDIRISLYGLLSQNWQFNSQSIHKRATWTLAQEWQQFSRAQTTFAHWQARRYGNILSDRGNILHQKTRQGILW